METGEPEKTADLEVGVWYRPDQDNIHLAAKDRSFITTVNNNPNSKRGHPHLFAHLARALKKAGKPYLQIEEDRDA